MKQVAPADGNGRSDDGASPDNATALERPLQARSEVAPALSFQPLNTPKQGLDKRIVAYIQQRIERGELRSGDRLPAERELAAQLGVSRTVLREALHTLAAYGLVDLQHGRGVFIAAGSAQAAAQRLTLAMISEETAPWLHELFEIRRTLEGVAAEWAALRATPQQIEELRANLVEGLAIYHSPGLDAAAAGALDARFHASLAAATNNRVLMSLMAALVDELAMARERSLAIPGRALRSLHQHESIVMAIEERDAAAARRAMLEHLNDVEQSILSGEPEAARNADNR
ncbi:MAG TPA: FadR/GntR family transcriptional regulator [Ktedonobacterales bacterium]